MNYDIQCYIRKDDGTSGSLNMRTRWPGMYVLEAKGIADYGKPKNIVTESYAEGDGIVAHIPSSVKREATEVTLKLCIFDAGTNSRYAQYDDFISYIGNSAFYYWDSVRMRMVRLLLLEKFTPNENFHGSVEYIEAEVKFSNIDGKPTDISSRWSVAWSSPLCALDSEGENTGVARNKVLTITKSGSQTAETFTITSAFDAHVSISDSDFQRLGDQQYAARLSNFNTYVIDRMMALHEGFFLTDIRGGASVTNLTLCPLPQ